MTLRRPAVPRRARDLNVSTILNVHLRVTAARRVEIVRAPLFVCAEALPLQPLTAETPLGRTMRPETV